MLSAVFASRELWQIIGLSLTVSLSASARGGRHRPARRGGAGGLAVSRHGAS